MGGEGGAEISVRTHVGGGHVVVWEVCVRGGGPSYLCRERDRDLRRRDLDRERECLRFSSFLTVDNEQRTQLWYSEGSRNQNENPEETALGN